MAHQEPELDALLAEARLHQPQPDPVFMRDALQAAIAMADHYAPAPLPARQTGPFGRLLAGLGGWKGASALTASTLAGLWLGYTQLSPLTNSELLYGLVGLTNSTATDAFSTIDALMAEG